MATTVRVRRNGTVRIPRQYGWKGNVARFAVVAVFVGIALNEWYPDLDIPLVPGVMCGDSGTTQNAQLPPGNGGTRPAGGARAVGYRAGEVLRDLSEGPPKVAHVRRSFSEAASGLGALVGQAEAAWDGAAEPMEKVPPKSGATATSTGGCVPCPTGGAVPSETSARDGADVAARAALRAGWTGDDAVTAVAVAGAESGWRHDAANDSSTARGMWQTMMSYHRPKYHGAAWEDPYANARVAHQIWRDAGGWSPWTVYTSGAYRSKLGAARAAVANVSGAGTVQTVAAVALTSPPPTPDGAVQVDGKRVSIIAARQLRLAESASGIDFRVMQGGYGGGHIAASGTSHNYPGVMDLAPASVATEKLLRQYGFAAWARNIPGRSSVGSGAHLHVVSLLDPGNRRAPQVYGSWPKRGNGLSGANNDPAPHYAWVPGLARAVGGTALTDGSGTTVPVAAKACAPGGTRSVSSGEGGSVGGANIGRGSFTAASFNVLGSNHTGGNGAARMPGALRMLAKHGVDVVGLQELQGSQWRAFKRLAGGSFGIWAPSRRHTDNAVAWRLSEFRFVRGSSVTIPYFEGKRQEQPVVLLEHRESRRQYWVGSFHNPAETAQHHNQGRWRAAATRVQVALARRVAATGVPLLITGDMNERDSYRAKLMGATGMHTLGGGWIDWVFGSSGVRFIGHRQDETPRRTRVSDHPIVVAEVGRAGFQQAS